MAATIDEETIEEEMNVNRKPRLYSGVMVRGGAELYPLLEEHCSSDTACFDFLVAPLYWAPTDHFLATSEKSGAFSSSGASHECEEDPLLSSSSWCHMVLGYVCGEFDLDSPSAEARSKASRALAAQIDWGAHLSLATIMLPPPLQGTNCANYAQTISGLLYSRPSIRFSCRIPLNGDGDLWQVWNKVRGLCDYHGNLSVALELSAELEEDEAALLRWLGEPVSTVHVPEALFYRGKSGELKTTRRHERFLVQLFRRGVRMVFEDSKEAGAECLQAIHVLHARRYQISEKEAFESPYYDYLQHPLQPLADHLENSTYETFERDPIKYQQYQEAIRRALCDRADLRPGKHLVVFVLGAGRGPLVKCALRAAGECGRQLKIYALDKNPNAVITLRHLKRVLGWGDAVTVVDSDMRQWDAPEQADIVVSELLGSFGDNELSPECLDGAEACHCFEPQRGISVPSSSTSFLAPVSCVKAWTDVRAYGTRKAFETCYVVKLHQATELAPAQPCFTFAHPNPQKSPNNARYSRLQFQAQATEELHGLVGYFECALYKDVLVSTNPASETPDMTSWFPMYFPVPSPLFVSKGDPIEVHMWRCVSASIVWYEWCIVTPCATSPILNPNGRSYFIRLH